MSVAGWVQAAALLLVVTLLVRPLGGYMARVFAGSALTAVVTSNGATGSYNAMHDSFTPLGGLVPLVNMQLGEIGFGGLGSGLYSIILLALLWLFLTGLMVGRTPEYLGK